MFCFGLFCFRLVFFLFRSREQNQQQTQPTYDAEIEQQIQPTCDAEVRNQNPGHIGWGRVLSTLRHPCSLKLLFTVLREDFQHYIMKESQMNSFLSTLECIHCLKTVCSPVYLFFIQVPRCRFIVDNKYRDCFCKGESS